MSDIGQRIKEAADEVGGLNQLAKLVGIPRRTLGNQIIGDSAKASLLVEVAQATRVSLEWLATGRGSKKPLDHLPKLEIDAELMERLHDRVATIFHEVGQKPPQRRIAREAANLYNDLANALPDIHDAEMLEVTLPRLALEFKRRIAEAEPGAGKRSAS